MKEYKDLERPNKNPARATRLCGILVKRAAVAVTRLKNRPGAFAAKRFAFG